MKRFFAAALGLVMIAAPLAASAEPYGDPGGHHDGRYRDGGYGGGGYRGGDRGWYGDHHNGGYRDGEDRRGERGWDGDRRRDGRSDVVAAGALGLILRAALASNSYGHRTYERCVWRTQAYETGWGRTEYRQVQVCR